MSSTVRLLRGGRTLKVGYSTWLSEYFGGWAGVPWTADGVQMGLTIGTGGITTGIAGGKTGDDDDEMEPFTSRFSCQRIHTLSNLDWPSAEQSWREARAMKTSDSTPVGMSQINVSRFTIFATAKATRVPSILPLSFVILYSATQSGGPFPNENFRVYFAYWLSTRRCESPALPIAAPRSHLVLWANLLPKHKVARPYVRASTPLESEAGWVESGQTMSKRAYMFGTASV